MRDVMMEREQDLREWLLPSQEQVKMVLITVSKSII